MMLVCWHMKIKVTRTVTEEIELAAGMTIFTTNSKVRHPRMIIFRSQHGEKKYGSMDPATGEITIDPTYTSIKDMLHVNYKLFGVIIDGNVYDMADLNP